MKCLHIQGELLRKVAPPLALRLAQLGVAPQLYMIKWLRLLFGREFHLTDCCGAPPLHDLTSRMLHVCYTHTTLSTPGIMNVDCNADEQIMMLSGG